MCGKVALMPKKRAPAARMAARMAEHPQVTSDTDSELSAVVPVSL